MRRKLITIIQARCRRGCGTLLATASRSIWGDEESKRKYELICENCLTTEEKEDMQRRSVNVVRGFIRQHH